MRAIKIQHTTIGAVDAVTISLPGFLATFPVVVNEPIDLAELVSRAMSIMSGYIYSDAMPKRAIKSIDALKKAQVLANETNRRDGREGKGWVIVSELIES